jgi:ribonucleoside-diphosphate reductase subunit M1
MATHHPDYGNLAARFVINDIYKKTKGTFSECVQALYDNMNVITKSHAPLVSDEFYSFVTAHATQLDAMIREDRDDDFDYFGIKTLEGSYLLRTNGNV